MKFPFPVVDADSHVYEPEAIWDRHVPVEYRAAARAALWHGVDDAGYETTILNGRPVRSLNRGSILRQAIWRPGTTPEDIGRLDPNVFHPLNPAAWDPGARLADMDTLGVEAAVLYPTIFAEHFPLVENPDAAAVLARAYNDWVLDFASAAPDRLLPVAVLPLQSALFARRELDRIAEAGFRAVMMRPMFYAGPVREERGMGASLARAARQAVGAGGVTTNARGVWVLHPHFRPLWEQIDQAGLVACVHPALGITNPEQTSEGSFVERVGERLGVGHTLAEPVAYMQDSIIFLTAALTHGLLEDLPSLRLALAHSGASWLPLCLEKTETYLWLSFLDIFQFSSPVSLEPEAVVARHPIVLSFDAWEESIGRMPDTFAGVAAWGSRYPHHDASDPAEAVAMLEAHGVAGETVAALMGGNAAGLFNLRAAARS